MIPSNPNPPMTNADVMRFHNRMARRMRGEFTQHELALYEQAKRTYEHILKNNGGKNPIFN